MKLDSDTLDYLLGKRLSNGHPFLVPHSRMVGRNQLLVELVQGMKVLHVGCADHIELIEKKRSEGNYLHDLICASATHTVGVDTNAEALQRMRALGIKNLFNEEEIDLDWEYDLVLIPDVIEHVNNVGEFLRRVSQYKCNRFIITTPNAFRLRNRRSYRHELINTDHRYWFSPYTLARALASNGFILKKQFYTDTPTWRQPIQSLLKWWFPLCRDGICAIVEKQTP